MTPLRVHHAASAEAAAAIRWYNEQQSGLGDDFRSDFIAAVDRIAERPLTWPISPDDPRARRCLLSRFPYSLVYIVRPAAITLVAVAHTRRRPAYWRRRIGP